MPTELEIAFEKFIEEKHKETERHYKSYRKGLNTSGELECLLKTIYCSYYNFLKENGIEIRISESNWENVLSDYEKWKTGKTLKANPENPWLISRYDSAPANEISLFFRIMEFMKLPIEYYSPIPASVPVPQISESVYGTCTKFYILGDFDDGGLLNEPDPIGKTFIFTDKYGLKTKIKIQKYGRNFHNCNEFIGIGTVEGYTSSTPAEIFVETYKNESISYLYLYDGKENPNLTLTYYKFPLWQEYFKLNHAGIVIFNKSQEIFFHEHFNKQ